MRARASQGEWRRGCLFPTLSASNTKGHLAVAFCVTGGEGVRLTVRPPLPTDAI